MNALSVELELGILDRQKRDKIINEIIQNIPPENSSSTTINFFAQTYDTLHAELDSLLDLK